MKKNLLLVALFFCLSVLADQPNGMLPISRITGLNTALNSRPTTSIADSRYNLVSNNVSPWVYVYRKGQTDSTFVKIGSAITLSPSSTISWTPTNNVSVYNITPTGSETINLGAIPSQIVNKTIFIIITTSGTSSYVITFGTNLRSQGVLNTGTVSGKKFVIAFIINSESTALELSRTTAL